MERLWHNMMDVTGAIWASRLEDGLVDAALEVFTPEEINQLDRPAMLSLARLLRDRLANASLPSTHDKLEGIRELLIEYPFAINFKYAATNGGGK